MVYERGTGFAERTMAGFVEAARRHGLEADARPCEESFDEVHAAVKLLLDERPGLSALVVHNEAAAGHVLAALRILGRRVPEDVSVVAICPDDIAERVSPALTSVLIPAEDVGRQAVRLLMAKLEGQAVPDSTLLEPRLTIRESSR